MGFLRKNFIPVSYTHLDVYKRQDIHRLKNIVDRIKIKITGKDPAKDLAILTDNKIKLMKKFEYIFDEDYYVNTLKIPKDYIKGFQYFCIEDAAFRKAMETKNKSLNKFLIFSLIVPLAENYNQYFACE